MRESSSFARFQRYFSSSVGTKLLIGITGLLLFVYMVLHLAGNVLIFAGPGIFNEYSHKLISNPLIIPIELGLLAVFLLHIYKTVRMLMANRAARPVGYQKKANAGHTSRKSFASSTMIASGLILLLFVVVHVKQFKFGSYYQTMGASADPRSVSHRDRGVPQSVLGAVLRDRHDRRRAAPAPRHCERLSVHRRRPPALHAAADDHRHPPGGRSSAPGSGIIPVWVYLTH